MGTASYVCSPGAAATCSIRLSAGGGLTLFIGGEVALVGGEVVLVGGEIALGGASKPF